MIASLFRRKPRTSNNEDLQAAARAERKRKRRADQADNGAIIALFPEGPEAAALEPLALPEVEADELGREIDADLLAVFSGRYARDATLLPYRLDADDTLWVAAAERPSHQLEQQVRWLASSRRPGCEIRYALAARDVLERAIDVHYPLRGDSAFALVSTDEVARVFGAPGAGPSATLGATTAGDSRGLVEHLLCLGVEQGASDILLDTWDSEFVVRFRVDGQCEPVLPGLPAHAGAQVISIVKQMARLKIYETEAQQSGGYEATVVVGERPRRVEFRVEVTPTVYGESCTIRVHDARSRMLDLDALVDDARTRKALRRVAASRRGMLVLSGPTESGKTTTLYSLLSEVDLSRENVVAIEDPVELRVRGVRPIQVNEQRGITFASSLRSVLRQNPDRILVGEIRDRETADLAVFAALTGHQVLTTAHADDAPRTVVRLLKEGIEPHNLAAILDVVVAQRLVGRTCRVCAEPRVPNIDQLLGAQLPVDEALRATPQWGRGCKLCRWTGIEGRIAIQETLRVTDTIRELIEAAPPSLERDLRRLAIADGMRSLRRAALDLLVDTTVSLDQVLLHTPPDPDYERRATQ